MMSDDEFDWSEEEGRLREEPEEVPYDLGERTARFAEAIVDFAKKIPVSPVTTRLISQLVGCGTSIGANYCEANDHISVKDFLLKVGTCRKEARETQYFLRIIARASPELAQEARKLWREARSLNLIFFDHLAKGKGRTKMRHEAHSFPSNLSNFEFPPAHLQPPCLFAISRRVEDSQKRLIVAAQGYHELGLWREAWGELDALSGDAQRRPDVLEMRILILINENNWLDALGLSRQLAEVAPQEEGGWVHSAYCLHELGRTDEAVKALLSAPPSLREKAIFHYNLACYSCVLGQIDTAREALHRSFALDKKYREYARADHDLQPLHPELQ